jgi:hypothetical protein
MANIVPAMTDTAMSKTPKSLRTAVSILAAQLAQSTPSMRNWKHAYPDVLSALP